MRTKITVIPRIKNFILRQCYNKDTCTRRDDISLEDYNMIKSALNYDGIIQNLGLLVLYRIDGTITLMIDTQQTQRIVDWINQKISSSITIESPPSSTFQNVPNNVTIHNIEDMSAFKVIIRDVHSNCTKQHKLRKISCEKRKDRRIKQRQGASRSLARVRQAINEGKKLLCIDVEAYEFAHHKLLEIGFCILENGNTTYHHYIVEENLKYANKKFVPNNRDNFDFGESVTLPLNDIMELLILECKRTDFLVGHAVQGDIDWLTKHGFDYSNRYYFDTSMIGRCVVSCEEKRTPGLLTLIEHFNIEHKNLHNAGNDSAYTMQVLTRMAESSS